MTDDKVQCKIQGEGRRFWIIGAGRFGRIAVDRITARIAGAMITVVDLEAQAFDQEDITTVRQNGIQWLADRLAPDAAVDIVIPAIPVHLAAEWLKCRLSRHYQITSLTIPKTWLARLPHAMPGTHGRAYVSHADFICPDDCPEPSTICTRTGSPRPMDMFRLLAGLNLPGVTPIVLRSRQLLPGVGGIRPSDLLDALESARTCTTGPLMIATACRCHGVVDLLRLESPEPKRVS
ncbi:MAG TPA: potassium transporter [Desulfosarcina sp.]|nr:potassium transporter [Desulfosarcina sp.]